MRTRRELLGALAAAPAFIASAQDTNSAVISAQNSASMARSCYQQAGWSELQPGRVGYGNPRVFGQLADSITSLRALLDSLGITSQVQQGAASYPRTADQVSGTYMHYLSNHAQLAALPYDFFDIVDLGVIRDDMQVSLAGSGDLLVDMDNAVQALRQYEAGSYAARLRRPHLVLARYSNDASHEAVLATSGGAMMMGGLSAVNAAGGVGVLTGSVVSAAGALGVALAWTGVGLFVLGATVVIYVAYRVYTQLNQEASPWQKPTDMPSQVFTARWSSAQGVYPPMMMGPEPSPERSIQY